MLRYYYGLLLILYSFTANGQAVSASYGDGCRLNFFNANGLRIFSLRGDELRYWYNSIGQVIVRDENTQITTSIAGIASLIDSIQDVCVKGACNSAPPTPTGFYLMGSPLYSGFGDSYSPLDTLAGRNLIGGIKYSSGVLNFSWVSLGTSAKFINYNRPYFASEALVTGSIVDYCDLEACYSDIIFSDTVYYPNRLKYLNNFIDSVQYNNRINGGSPDTTFNSIKCNIFQHNGLNIVDNYELGYIAVTNNNDTTYVNDIVQMTNGGSSGNVRRLLGVTIDSIQFLNDSSQIRIVAYPVKTYDNTFSNEEGGGFAFYHSDYTLSNGGATIYDFVQFTASYGSRQSYTFDIRDKNTFTIIVGDTSGRSAYVIFQLTKENTY